MALNQVIWDAVAASPRLPLIDLSEIDGPQHDRLVKTLAMAAQTCGFFQVLNHGLSDKILDDLKQSAYRFFDQSEDKKAVYQNEAIPTQLVSYLSVPAAMEIMRMDYTNDEDALKYWPESCKEVALEYLKISRGVADRLLGLLMDNLGVTLDESMVDAYMGDKSVIMNYYPACPDQNKNVDLHKHTDPTVLTILLQDHIGGLFGKLNEDGDGDMHNNYKGEWIEIKPIPGALVIFAGDSLQVLSNGKYKAGEHYVQRTGTEIRVSLPVFMNPKPTTNIGPLPQVVEKVGGKPRYKQILFEEFKSYANEEFKSYAYSNQSLDIKATDFLQISSP